MKVKWGDDIPNIWKIKMVETTNQIVIGGERWLHAEQLHQID